MKKELGLIQLFRTNFPLFLDDYEASNLFQINKIAYQKYYPQYNLKSRYSATTVIEVCKDQIFHPIFTELFVDKTFERGNPSVLSLYEILFSATIKCVNFWRMLMNSDRSEEELMEYCLQALKINKSLLKLHFDKCKFSVSCITFLNDILLFNTNLRELVLFNCNLDDLAFEILCHGLRENKTLKHLAVRGNPIQEIGIITLSELLTNNHYITSLNLSHHGVRSVSINYGPIFESLEKNPSVTSLDIQETTLSFDSLNSLSHCISVNKVLKICLFRRVTIVTKSYRPWNLISALKNNNTITELDISRNVILDDDYSDFGTILSSNQSLRTLNLAYTLQGDSIAFSIANAIKKNRTLTDLNLSGCKFTVSGFNAIVESLIQDNQSITAIYLNRFRDIDIDILGRMISSNTTLKQISLDNCHISEIQFKHIMEAIKHNQTLQIMSLKENKINQGKPIIDMLNNNKTLEVLNLIDNEIQSFSVLSIAKCLTSQKRNRMLIKLKDNNCKEICNLIANSDPDWGIYFDFLEK